MLLPFPVIGDSLSNDILEIGRRRLAEAFAASPALKQTIVDIGRQITFRETLTPLK